MIVSFLEVNAIEGSLWFVRFTLGAVHRRGPDSRLGQNLVGDQEKASPRRLQNATEWRTGQKNCGFIEKIVIAIFFSKP